MSFTMDHLVAPKKKTKLGEKGQPSGKGVWEKRQNLDKDMMGVQIDW